jgi:anti-anti-sigma regulatory factor
MASAIAQNMRTLKFSLPADCRVAVAGTLFTALSEQIVDQSNVLIDASAVTEADTATVQLLLLACQELTARGGSLTLDPVSPELAEALQAAGADALTKPSTCQ